MKLLPIRKRTEQALLDDEDHDRLKDIKFYKIGTRGFAIGRIYVKQFKFKSKQVYQSLANAVMQTEGIVYDHIDRNPLNNQKTNLRVCNQSQNNLNRDKVQGFSSKYKGVYRNRNKWLAQIKINYKKIHLGSFSTEKEAALAYNQKALELQKEFANLNQIE